MRMISSKFFPLLWQVSKEPKRNTSNWRQPDYLRENHCGADTSGVSFWASTRTLSAERQEDNRRASCDVGILWLTLLTKRRQVQMLCLETKPETQSKMASFWKPHTFWRRRKARFYLHTWTGSSSLPQPTPSCQPRCLAGLHCNLFSFIMLICGRKDFCHLRIACTAMVNTLACL